MPQSRQDEKARRVRRLVMSAVLGVALLSAGSAAAQDGACVIRKIVGPWGLRQSDGTNVEVRPQQAAEHIAGIAEYSHYNNDTEKVETVGGPIDGSINGDRVSFVVYWSNSTSGRYDAQIDANGALSGVTVDRNNPQNKATFVTGSGSIEGCLVAAPPPPPPPPPVALGRTQAPAKLPTLRNGGRPLGEVSLNPGGGLEAPLRGGPVGRLPAADPAASVKAICDAAENARAHSSPLAPELEGRCAAAKAEAAASR
jgi:hypothetical protein